MASQLVQPFLHSAQLYPQHSDRYTDHTMYNICSNRPHLCITCRQCCLKALKYPPDHSLKVLFDKTLSKSPQQHLTTFTICTARNCCCCDAGISRHKDVWAPVSLYFLCILMWPTRTILAANCWPRSSQIKGLVSGDSAAGTDCCYMTAKTYKLMHDNKPSFDFEVGWLVGHRLHQRVAFYDVLHPNPFLFCLLFRLLHTHTHIYS